MRWAPRRLRADPRDRGSALIEFAMLAVALLIPVTLAATTLLQLHEARTATQIAAAEAVRAFTSADSSGAGWGRARAAARVAVTAVNKDASVVVSVRCSRSPCLSPTGRVRITVDSRVPASTVGGFDLPFSGRFRAIHEAEVDHFRAVS